MLSESPFPQLEQLPPVVAGTSPGEAMAGMRVHHETERRAMGYDAGYQEGLADARADALAEVQVLAKVLDQAAQEYLSRENTGIESFAIEAVDLALKLSEAIIGREVAASSAPGRDGLVRALALAPKGGPLEAHLNPTDVQTLGDISSLDVADHITIVADATVEPGGCVMVAGATKIDAQIGSALERVRAELLSEELIHAAEQESPSNGGAQ